MRKTYVKPSLAKAAVLAKLTALGTTENLLGEIK